MPRILIVEDEAKIARFIELELTHEGYEVEKAVDGRAGVDLALAHDFDLILLDVMLPQLNGLEVLRRVRREKATPVIMLTARDAVMDKVAGLDAGADDYITKPFAIEELLARVRVALKHQPAAPAPAGSAAPTASAASTASAPVAVPVASVTTPSASATAAPAAVSPAPAVSAPVGHRLLTCGPLVLDIEGRTVTVGGEDVQLTGREFEVLRALLEHRGTVMTRDRLAQLACGYDYVGETNIIDVYIRHLRAKIDDRFGLELIATVRGVGYVIRKA